MPAAGLVVIAAILALFVFSLILLFRVCAKYRRLSAMIGSGDEQNDPFLRYTLNEYAAAFQSFGEETNTPAIVENAVDVKLTGPLFCERFLNNAVSVFVTLGLFGTFLGLSLSVSSLTELIGYSNTAEWLSVLDSVGGGLMSALSGMGVAFYTSLVGVACAIVLTVLRTIFSPQSAREKLATQMELWLDHMIAPTLPTDAVQDDTALVNRLTDAMKDTAASMDRTMRGAAADFRRTLEGGREQLQGFQNTVAAFNEGVRDFSEFNYSLRGTVERMDVSMRELVTALRNATRDAERGGKA